MAQLTRRQFLKSLAGMGAIAAMPKLALAFDMTPDIYTPPAVMLHSRHWRVLPDLLAQLRDLGYSGITYRDWEDMLMGRGTLPDKPVILSVDDLSLEVGNPAFKYFKGMKDHFVNYGFKAVFSIITRPNLKQNSDRWTEVSTWVNEGMELATHTAYHSNLDNPKFTTLDYHTEIIDSAAMIEQQTGQPVRALVTPYGSGYDIDTHTLNPNVLEACREANLRFIVGISTGIRHVHADNQAGDVIYCGRANPGTDHTINDTLYYIQYW